MANTGEPIGVDYPTLMPDLTDIADIQQAYQMYHIGIADWNGIDPPAADSIEGHFAAINQRAQDLEDRPVAGGEYGPTEPTVVGPASLPVPSGYIWVDSDATSGEWPDMPTVIYSPTEPTGLDVTDVGTIWVDEDGTAMVLNVNDYQPITKYLASAPASPVVGQMWVDSDTGILYFYNGSSWQEMNTIAIDPFMLMGA